MRLYARPVPPTDDDVVREVGAYAAARIVSAPRPTPPAAAAVRPIEDPAEVGRASGIIEID